MIQLTWVQLQLHFLKILKVFFPFDASNWQKLAKNFVYNGYLRLKTNHEFAMDVSGGIFVRGNRRRHSSSPSVHIGNEMEQNHQIQNRVFSLQILNHLFQRSAIISVHGQKN